jgi:hypothetical protein
MLARLIGLASPAILLVIGLALPAPAMAATQTTGVIKALDAWEEPSVMTAAWFAQAHHDGFKMIVLQDDTVLTPATAASTEAMVKAAEAAGLQVAAFTCDPSDYAAGVAAFGGLPMAFFAFDIEPGNGPGGSNCNGSGSAIVPVTAAEVAAIKADGIKPVIYSFSNGWQGGDGFTSVPLWVSQDNSGVTLKNWKPGLAPFSPAFGEWTQADVMAVQDVYLEYDGVWVDLDSVSASY